MINLKLFEDFNNQVTEKEIEEYLNKNYTSDWFDSELSNRVYDYIDEDDTEDYEGDYEEAYQNLSTGGAIEYDLLDEMSSDVSKHFKIDTDKVIETRDITDICNDHLIDNCSWYDSFIFNKSNVDIYKNPFDEWDLEI